MTDRPTPDLQNLLQGLWLPLVTPFRNGELDEISLRRMVRHYASGPVDGLILAATSGEGMSLGSDELERLVSVTRAEIAASGRYLPICLGLSGASTLKMTCCSASSARNTYSATSGWVSNAMVTGSATATTGPRNGTRSTSAAITPDSNA